MVGLKVAAVFAALFALGESLKCYTGTTLSTTSLSAQAETICNSGSQCQKLVATVSGISSTTRSCSSSCTPSTNNWGGTTSATTCCSSDLCNGVGSSGGGSSGGGSSGGSSKSCYACTGCEDPFDSTQASEVSCSSGKCSKSLTWVGDTKITSKSCNPLCAEGDFRIMGMGSETFCCEGDKCNTALTLTANMATMLMTLRAAILVLLY